MSITLEAYYQQCDKNEYFSDLFFYHIEAIGIDLTERNKLKNILKKYKQWCQKNGFEDSLDKTRHNFKKERTLARIQRADRRLAVESEDKNLKKFIKKLLIIDDREKIIKIKPYGRIASSIIFAIEQKTTTTKPTDLIRRKLFLNCLLYLEKISKLLNDPVFIHAIYELCKWDWIRDYKKWKPASHNRFKQFSSLARFLLCKYDVPVFMDSAWFNPEPSTVSIIKEQQQKWFIHLGSGKNIRTAENLPFPLTKKMAHQFLQAPNDYDIETAFYWGQVHAIGGDQRVLEALRDTKVMSHSLDYSFNMSVIKFFINNPLLDTAHYNPIVDYIWEKKYKPRTLYLERGVATELPPEQPNFTMAGRSVDSLLKQVERWHRQLGKEKKGGLKLYWKHTEDINDYKIQFGTVEKKNMRFYRIRELLSSDELSAEGRAMHNCVASFAHSCHEGKSSIWSMTFENFDGIKHLMTIEVTRDRQLRAARGPNNKIPEKNEMNILNKWVQKENLRVPSYFRF